MSRILVICHLVLLVAGCSSLPEGRVTFTTYTQEVTLSRQQPVSDFLHARLVSVGKGGVTTIEVIPTGEILQAEPGEFFVSSAYGTKGLHLVSASKQNQDTHLIRTWCEGK